MTQADASPATPVGVCSKCGTPQRVSLTSVVDSVATPDEFKQAVGGVLNFVRCTRCGNTIFANAPFVVRDASRNLLALYTGYLARASAEDQASAIQDLMHRLSDAIGEPVTLGNPEIHDDYQALHERLRALYEPGWVALLRRVANLPAGRQAPELAAAPAAVLRELIDAVQNKRIKFPNVDQVVESLQVAVLAARQLSDSPVLAACLLQLGVTALKARRFAEAEPALREAESLYTSVGDPSNAAFCRSRLGFVYQDQKDFPRATEAFRNAADRYEELNQPYMQLLQLASLGEVLADAGDTQAALASLTRATELARKETREFEMGFCERRIATVYRRSGNLEAAAQFLRSAAEHFRAAGKASDYSDMMHALVEVQSELGQGEAALGALESAIAWHGDHSNLDEVAVLELDVARVRAESGSWAASVAAIERAAAAHSQGDPRKQALDYFSGGRLAQSHGQWATALELLQKASDAYTKAGDADGFAASQYNMAVCHLAQNNAEQALAFAKKAAESFPDATKMVRALLLIAMCLVKLSRFDDARNVIGLMDKVMSSVPDPVLAPAILNLRSQIALADNDVDGARALLEQSLNAAADPLVRATVWLSIARLHRGPGATAARTSALENAVRELESVPQTLLTLPVSIELADALVKQREYRSARALLDSITPLLITLAADTSPRQQATFNTDFAIVLQQPNGNALSLGAMAQLVFVCLHLRDYKGARASAQLAISVAQGTESADQTVGYEGILAWLDFKLGGNVHSALARLQDATAKARAARRSELLRMLLNQLAGVAAVAGETDLALKSITEAIDVTADADPDLLAEFESTRAFILRKLGRYAEAVQHVDRTLATQPSGGSSPGAASLKLAKAELFGDMARYRDAIDLYESVAQAAREMEAPELLAMALGGQGRLAFFLADYPKALAAHTQALALWRKVGDLGNTAAELADLGMVHRSLGDAEAAIKAFEEAAAIETETGREVSRAITLGNMADLLADRRAALAAYSEALDIFRRAGEAERIGHMLLSLAGAHYELEETGRASEYIEQAIAQLTATGSSRFLINAYTVRSFVREAQGKLEDAYSDALEALTRKQRVRGGLARAADRLTYARVDAGQVEDRAIALAAATSREREAWVLVESVKSRLLAEELTTHDWPAPPGVPGSLVEREHALLGQLRSCELGTHSFDTLPGRSSSPRNVDGVLEELHRVWREIEAFAPDYSAMRRGDSLPYDELANALRTEGDDVLAALELILLGNSLLTVAYRSDWQSPAIRTVGLDANDEQEILTSFENEVIEYPRHVRAKLPFLHSWRAKLEALLAPALQPLLDASCLYLVPHGWLHNLPLHALRVGDESVAAQTRLAYVPSITVLARLLRARPRRAFSGERLVVGYSEEVSTQPDIEGEAEDVARIISATPLIGAAATRDNISKAFGRATLIHLSCHCGFDRESPLDSSIALADGPLSAARLMTYDLGGAFVNLSGCETALVMRDAADEPMGIPRAALLAGAGGLLATLWRVDTAATRYFMNVFYTRLSELGEGRIGYTMAVRDAAASLRLNADFEPPYFWAAFKLIGPIHDRERDVVPVAGAPISRP